MKTEAERRASRNYKLRHPERVKAQNRNGRLRRFGLTADDFDHLLREQGGCCAICGDEAPGGSGSWHVDHDHTCCPGKSVSCGNCVRGLLCNRCNQGLGHFKDNTTRLRAAANYLEKHG